MRKLLTQSKSANKFQSLLLACFLLCRFSATAPAAAASGADWLACPPLFEAPFVPAVSANEAKHGAARHELTANGADVGVRAAPWVGAHGRVHGDITRSASQLEDNLVVRTIIER